MASPAEDARRLSGPNRGVFKVAFFCPKVTVLLPFGRVFGARPAAAAALLELLAALGEGRLLLGREQRVDLRERRES